MVRVELLVFLCVRDAESALPHNFFSILTQHKNKQEKCE